jgi:hypothetical protein
MFNQEVKMRRSYIVTGGGRYPIPYSLELVSAYNTLISGSEEE